jgi:RNA-directed DNA polymerase
VLANLALDGLQNELAGLFRTVRDARAAKVNYVRYADDFIITGSSKELLKEVVEPLVQKFMRERGLELSEKKTFVTHVNDGFDFLGWTVRWQSRMLLTKPSDRNVKRLMDKVRETLRDMCAAAQVDVIDKLNPVIRGWANYHRSQMAARTFAKVEHRIWQALWRWARRRHPQKGRRWIKARYFRRIAGRDWRFADRDKVMLSLMSFHKKPHIKIDSSRNPYDRVDEDYFDARLARQMQSELKGRRKLAWLWYWQEGLCPHCGQKITRETGWHVHHVIKRSKGGSDRTSNLALLHPNCHMQFHVTE